MSSDQLLLLAFYSTLATVYGEFLNMEFRKLSSFDIFDVYSFCLLFSLRFQLNIVLHRETRAKQKNDYLKKI